MAMAAAATSHMTAIDLGNEQRGNDGANRESGKVGPRYAAHFDFRKTQVIDPGCGDDWQADHDSVANQRHVDADRK